MYYHKTNNPNKYDHKLHKILAIIAFIRETFSQYFIIKISINVTINSQIIIYRTSPVINNGMTNRNNGRVIVDAKTHTNKILKFEI